jgi:hypothetical protein
MFTCLEGILEGIERWVRYIWKDDIWEISEYSNFQFIGYYSSTTLSEHAKML